MRVTLRISTKDDFNIHMWNFSFKYWRYPKKQTQASFPENHPQRMNLFKDRNRFEEICAWRNAYLGCFQCWGGVLGHEVRFCRSRNDAVGISRAWINGSLSGMFRDQLDSATPMQFSWFKESAELHSASKDRWLRRNGRIVKAKDGTFIFERFCWTIIPKPASMARWRSTIVNRIFHFLNAFYNTCRICFVVVLKSYIESRLVPDGMVQEENRKLKIT